MQVKEVETKKGLAWEVVGYLGRYSDNKPARARKRGFTSKRSAIAWFNNEKVLFENGQSKYNKKELPNVLTVEQLYKIWLESYQNTVEESTLNKVLSYFSLHIIPVWGNSLVTEITPLKLQRYVNTMQSTLLNYKKIVGYLSRILDMAVKMDMLTVNPFNKVELPRERKTPKTKQFMDAEEFRSFINVLDSQYSKINQQAYTLLRLAAFTGMRTEELLALQWRHVDFTNGYISIEQALGRGLRGGTYLKEPKSRTSRRTLKIDNTMLVILGRWYETTMYNDSQDFVFCQEGNTLQILRPNKWLHDVSEQYGVAEGLSFHKLRHTWATLALEGGASVKQVQTYLGHADASITLNVYSDITKSASDKTGSILSIIMEESNTKKNTKALED